MTFGSVFGRTFSPTFQPSSQAAASESAPAVFIPIDDESLRPHARNQGALPYLETNTSPVNLFRFDLSSVPSSNQLASATLTVTIVGVTYQGRIRTGALYEVATASADWIEGTGMFTSNAKEGEPTYLYKEANGSGGAKTYWAGGGSWSASDYNATVLSDTVSLDDSDSVGDTYVFTFNAAGLAVIESWFGQSTNGGLAFIHGTAAIVNLGSVQNETESYRPKLELVYQ